MKRILGYLSFLLVIMACVQYYMSDIITIPPIESEYLQLDGERYVLQVDGGKIVSENNSVIRLNEFAILGSYPLESRTVGISVKPYTRHGKVTWFVLPAEGKGRFYQFFKIQTESGDPLPYRSYRLDVCGEKNKFEGYADSLGYTVAYFTEKPCGLTLHLNY